MDAWTERLDRYVDGELSLDDQAAVAEHLRQCTECAADALSRVRLKRAVHSAARRYVPDAAFRQRVEKQLGRRRKAFAFRPWWIPLAAAILVATLVPWLLSNRRSSVEYADLHVAALAPTATADVVSSDRHTVKPWFQGKIPFAFELPELQGTGFTLVGGRLVYVNQSPSAQLIYQVRQHKLSVFILQERNAPSFPGGVRRESSFTTDSWAAAGLTYVIVTDAAKDDVEKLAAMLKNAANK